PTVAPRSGQDRLGTGSEDAFRVFADRADDLGRWSHGVDESGRLAVQQRVLLGVGRCFERVGSCGRRHLLRMVLELCLAAVPRVGEAVAAYALADPRGPRHPRHDVVGAGEYGVGPVAGDDEALVDVVHLDRFGGREERGPSHAPSAPAIKAAASVRPLATPPAARTGTSGYRSTTP